MDLNTLILLGTLAVPTITGFIVVIWRLSAMNSKLETARENIIDLKRIVDARFLKRDDTLAAHMIKVDYDSRELREQIDVNTRIAREILGFMKGRFGNGIDT